MTGRSFLSGFAKYWGFERATSRFFYIRLQSALWLLACRLAQAVSAMFSRYPPTCPHRRKPALFRRFGLEFYALFRRLFFSLGNGLGRAGDTAEVASLHSPRMSVVDYSLKCY